MICVFCDNKTTTGCIHCNPNGFGIIEIQNTVPVFKNPLEQQLDRIEALLINIRDSLETLTQTC